MVGNKAAMMSRFGYGYDRRIRKLYEWMIVDQREDGGWNCSQGKPGTLDCWEALFALSTIPKACRTAAIERAIERGAEFCLERNLFKEAPIAEVLFTESLHNQSFRTYRPSIPAHQFFSLWK